MLSSGEQQALGHMQMRTLGGLRLAAGDVPPKLVRKGTYEREGRARPLCVVGDVARRCPVKCCGAARADGDLRQASREDSLRSLCFCHAAKFDF